MILGLDHVRLAGPKGSEDAARAFHGGLLGLEEVEEPEPLKARGGGWFRVGSRQSHLGVEGPFRAAAKAHPALLVDNATALFGRLETAGVRGAWDEALPGVARLYEDDPWGNRLEFVEAAPALDSLAVP